MRCVSHYVGAAVLATICVGNGARADQVAEARANPSFLIFSGVDLWRQGSFTHGGVLWSPDGLDKPGFTFKALLGGGSYRYHSGALGQDVSGEQIVGFALPGWRFRSGDTFLTLFAGLDVQRHRLQPDDPGNRLRGTHAGLRVAAELWMQPTPHTMFAADASVSSVGPSYAARAVFGWRLFDRFYLGPEVQAFRGDDAYQQWRVGLHLTGLKAADFEWNVAIGYADDSDDRDGPYLRAGLLLRQ